MEILKAILAFLLDSNLIPSLLAGVAGITITHLSYKKLIKELKDVVREVKESREDGKLTASELKDIGKETFEFYEELENTGLIKVLINLFKKKSKNA